VVTDPVNACEVGDHRVPLRTTTAVRELQFPRHDRAEAVRAQQQGIEHGARQGETAIAEAAEAVRGDEPSLGRRAVGAADAHARELRGAGVLHRVQHTQHVEDARRLWTEILGARARTPSRPRPARRRPRSPARIARVASLMHALVLHRAATEVHPRGFARLPTGPSHRRPHIQDK
jgi:hypothetical protein